MLLDKAKAFIESQSEEMQDYEYRDLPMHIHALRGDVPAVLAAMERAIEHGWRSGWWRVQHNPHFDLLRDNAQFLKLMDEVERLAKQ